MGSSTQYRSNCDSRPTLAIASATSQRWFASTDSLMLGPTASRTSFTRLMSSSMSAPTFNLIWVKPLSSAALTRARTLSSEYPSQPAEVVYAG